MNECIQYFSMCLPLVALQASNRSRPTLCATCLVLPMILPHSFFPSNEQHYKSSESIRCFSYKILSSKNEIAWSQIWASRRPCCWITLPYPTCWKLIFKVSLTELLQWAGTPTGLKFIFRQYNFLWLLLRQDCLTFLTVIADTGSFLDLFQFFTGPVSKNCLLWRVILFLWGGALKNNRLKPFALKPRTTGIMGLTNQLLLNP